MGFLHGRVHGLLHGSRVNGDSDREVFLLSEVYRNIRRQGELHPRHVGATRVRNVVRVGVRVEVFHRHLAG